MGRTLLLPLLCAALLQHVVSEDVEITTTKGTIKGLKLTSPTLIFDAFIGVPYGDKPDRFQLAKARTAWSTTLTTQADAPVCPQTGTKYDEDCLYLNVYTPNGASASTTKFPVMAFLPGGYFLYCSASSQIYGPDFLLTGNVIVVTINYRVGATGFLSLGSKAAPGNLGLHDTLLALQWIQDEISAFGGDKSQVTLFGESAGSVMTQMHYISPLSTGLFQRAIAQSGSALANWGLVTTTEARKRALQMAKSLNCDVSKDDTTIVQCLQKANIGDIIGNQSTIGFSDYSMIAGTDVPFVPVLDFNSTADKPFFNDLLENLLKSAVSRAKPLMTGITSDEGILLFSKPGYLKAENNLAAFLNEGSRGTNNVNGIKNLYFNQSSPTLNKIKSLVSIYTDTMFAYPAIKVSRELASFTYGYEFAYDGTWFPQGGDFYKYNVRGVPHGADLAYLFYNPQYMVQSMDTCTANAGNLNIKNNMVTWWTNFTKKGVPADTWPTIAKGGYFVINSQTSIKDVATFEKEHNYDFWTNAQKASNFAIAKSANVLLTLFISLSVAVKRFYL